MVKNNALWLWVDLATAAPENLSQKQKLKVDKAMTMDPSMTLYYESKYGPNNIPSTWKEAVEMEMKYFKESVKAADNQATERRHSVESSLHMSPQQFPSRAPSLEWDQDTGLMDPDLYQTAVNNAKSRVITFALSEKRDSPKW